MPTPHPTAHPPRLGALLLDTATGRLGVLMDDLGGSLWLRPPTGGVEWEARPCDVRPAGQPSSAEEAAR